MKRRIALLLALAAAVPTAAAADPALEQAPDVLDAALACSPGLAGATRDPVLLVPGTALNPEQFDWNYVPALTADGVPHCTVALVDNGTGDIQASAERIVHAIRTMHAISGRRVDVIGHSQGGMAPRWAVRFWPEVAAMVDDLVGLAASNHGTVVADAFCVAGCAASIWQQRTGSAFLAALNEGTETVAGIDYTQIYTHYDAVVVPNLDEGGSTSLRTGEGATTNVAVQDLCPLAVTDHLTIGTSDAVAYALARDAVDHDGPADPSRVPPSVCAEPFMPGVDPLTFVADFAAIGVMIATSLASAPPRADEPPLRCYVTATCGAADDPEPQPGAPVAADPGLTLPATGGAGPPALAALALAAAVSSRARWGGRGWTGRRPRCGCAATPGRR